MLEKRNRMAKIVVMVCIGAVAAFAGIAQAKDGGWGAERCGKQQRHNFNKFENKLGLTDAQKAEAKAIFQGNKDVVKPIMTSLQAERKNLQSLIHADSIDEAAIRAESAKIAEIQADLNVNRAKSAAEFRAILTPAQLAILKTLQQKSY
ncbi:MAG: Spy/CpxP family protein refolding chaperone [Desulfuromonadaceae bacterium]|nr:Spy/CpxP family protein refolding chaperone [Desulfuromonadaceae bacterium]